MYLMGAPYMRRRKSALIDGAADDATELSEEVERFLG
jgi:putative flavoprotein involved in K+ transport